MGVKGLLCKQEDVSLDPQHLRKRAGCGGHAPAGEEDPWGLLASHNISCHRGHGWCTVVAGKCADHRHWQMGI